MTEPPIVIPPVKAVEPTIKVAAVIFVRSVPLIPKVPVTPPMEIDFDPFGIRVTMPLAPELTAAPNETSWAVIEMGELFVVIAALLDMAPVPSAEIVRLPVDAPDAIVIAPETVTAPLLVVVRLIVPGAVMLMPPAPTVSVLPDVMLTVVTPPEIAPEPVLAVPKTLMVKVLVPKVIVLEPLDE